MAMHNEKLAQDEVSFSQTEASPKTELGRGYYRDGHWGQCLELLQHLCQYSDHILLVSGQSGIGKSALASALSQSNSQDIKYCGLSGTQCQNIGNVLAQVAKGFNLPWPVNDQDEQAKHAWMEQVDKHDQTWVLLIDDAGDMPQDVLESLLHLAYPNNHQARFHLVLFGLPQLEKALYKANIKGLPQGRLHVIELETLTLDEVEGFLIQLWSNAGNHTELPFKPALIKKIYQISGGMPSEVVRLANAYLKGDKLERRGQRVLQHFFSPIGLGVSILGGLMLAFMLAVLLMDFGSESKIKTVELPAEPLSVDVQQENQIEVEDKLNQLKSIAIHTSNEEKGQALPTQNLEAMLSANAPRGRVTTQAASSSVQVSSFEEVISSTEQADPRAAQSLDVSTSTTSAVSSLETTLEALDNGEVQTPAKEAVSADIETISAPTMTLEDKKEALAKISQGLPEAPKPKPVATSPKKQAPKVVKPAPVKKAAANSAKFTWSENFLLKKQSSHMALQLLGTSSEANMKKFIDSNNLKGKAFYYRSTRNQKPWFVLIYGDYATREAAMAAVKQLPAKVQGLKPWPRTYASIHRSIKEGR